MEERNVAKTWRGLADYQHATHQYLVDIYVSAMLKQDKAYFELKNRIFPPLIKTPEFMSFVEEMCNHLPEEKSMLLKNISTVGKESKTQLIESFVCEKITQIMLENLGVAMCALPHLDNADLGHKIGERLFICTNAHEIRQASKKFCLEVFLGYNHSLLMAKQPNHDSRLLAHSMHAFYYERKKMLETIALLNTSKFSADLK